MFIVITVNWSLARASAQTAKYADVVVVAVTIDASVATNQQAALTTKQQVEAVSHPAIQQQQPTNQHRSEAIGISSIAVR